MEKMKYNYLYNVLYHIFSLLTPLIVTPYITRVISESLVGENALVCAKVSYFCLAGTLGITILGVRKIAAINQNNNIEILNNTFWELYFVQFTSYLVILGVYIIFSISQKQNNILFYLYIIYILSMMLDVSWFFQGIEDFKIICLRNIVIRILSTALIFVFVKEKSDINIYVICLYFPQLIMNVWMFFSAKLKYNLKAPCYTFDTGIFRSSLLLAIPTIAISAYTILDKIILGAFRTPEEVAVYEQGQVLIRFILSITSAWGTVVLPRMANVLGKDNSKENANNLLYKSSKTIFFLAFALFFGALAINKPFIDWYLPDSYREVVSVIYICSPMIVIVSVENLLGVQVLLAREKDKQYTISLVVAALVNCLLDFVFVPLWGIQAACVCSVLAEMTAMILQVVFCRKEIEISKLLKNAVPYLVIGIFMLFIIRGIIYLVGENIIVACGASLVGAIFYILMTVKTIRE